MIQRIQSVFLLIVVLCGVGLLISFGNPSIDAGDFSSFQDILGIISYILIYFSIILAVICILRYKNRNLQIRICNWIIWINLPILATSSYLCYLGALIAQTFTSSLNILLFLTWIILPVISITFTFIARRYIKKDEELVRSADRIR